MKPISAVSALTLLVATISSATASDRVETIRFKGGATSVTLAATVRGYDGIRYVLGADTGQLLSAIFRPSNRSCYMNVWTPGSDTAAFIGSSTGNEYGGNVSVSGNYTVQVHLMRNAARRNQRCRYHLTIEISDPRARVRPHPAS
jgi:hypothetical protein